MSSAEEDSGDSLTRRDALKSMTGVVGAISLFSVGSGLKVLSGAGATMSAISSRKLQTLYLILQTKEIEPHCVNKPWFSGGDEAIRQFSQDILKDPHVSPALHKALDGIAELSPQELWMQRHKIAEKLRAAIPGIHGDVVRDYEENIRINDEGTPPQKDEPTSPTQENKAQHIVQDIAPHTPLLSADTEQVVADINAVTGQGQSTGREPFVERLMKQKGRILPRK